jgi:hypothetical protein
MSWLSITVPGVVTVTEPCTTVSFVPGGTPVFVGPGLPGGSGAVGEAVGVGFAVTVGFTVGFGVGLGLGFGFVVCFANEGEADDGEAVTAGADVDAGAVDEPGTTPSDALELDDDVPGSEEPAAELDGGWDCAAPTLLLGSRSMTAATISPPSSTSTSETTTTRSRTEPGIGILRLP